MIYGKDYFGFIYKWVNHVNKKYYIGSHYGPLDDGYVGSGVWFRRAYNKNPENFSRTILKYLTSEDPVELLTLEQQYLITECEVGNKDKCYNISRRAGGGWQLAGKADSEIAEIYSKISNTLKNKTEQERIIITEKIKTTLAENPERCKIAIEKMKTTKRLWDDQKKKTMVEKMKNTLHNNPDIKEKARQKFINTISMRTDEQKQKIKNNCSSSWTDERRKQMSVRIKQLRAQRTPEQIAADRQKASLAQLNRDPEKRKEAYQKSSETFKNRSVEEKEKSKQKRLEKINPKKDQINKRISEAKRKIK